MERQTGSGSTKSVFTIGHSNHPIEVFLGLLLQHDIDVLVDTRSFPFSKFATQFDQDNLQSAVNQNGIKYLFLGRELGGKPKEATYYDEEGHVLYWKIAESTLFKQGIDRLLNGIESYRIALLCSEEDPVNCHRRRLVGRVLKDYGIVVRHIRGSGTIQAETEVELAMTSQAQQMNIFSPGGGGEPWRSIQSVLRKKPLLSSSNP